MVEVRVHGQNDDIDLMTSNNKFSASTENNGPATKVFAIPELLEAILLHLSTRDLLLSQRVAKTWKTTIDGSHLLRQALFLDPIPAQTAWIARLNPEGEQSSPKEPNTFSIGKYTVTQLPASQLPNISDSTTFISNHVTLNTLLLTRGHFQPLTLRDRLQNGEGLRLHRPKHAPLGPGAEMFLTQPPCKELLLWVDWGKPSSICREEGVRFRDVWEVVERAPVVPYLPHLFMLGRGCVALTREEEGGMVGGEVRLEGEGVAGEEGEEGGEERTAPGGFRA